MADKVKETLKQLKDIGAPSVFIDFLAVHSWHIGQPKADLEDILQSGDALAQFRDPQDLLIGAKLVIQNQEVAEQFVEYLANVIRLEEQIVRLLEEYDLQPVDPEKIGLPPKWEYFYSEKERDDKISRLMDYGCPKWYAHLVTFNQREFASNGFTFYRIIDLGRIAALFPDLQEVDGVIGRVVSSYLLAIVRRYLDDEHRLVHMSRTKSRDISDIKNILKIIEQNS